MKHKTGLATILIVGGIFISSPATAQPVKPNILIVFDTSGSMFDRSGGGAVYCDGQIAPVGNGSSGRDTRIYNLKAAIAEALFYAGVDEANFGLARFPHQENACNLDSCSFGSSTAGYYHIVSAEWGGDDGHPGCKLSEHNEETSYGTWFDQSVSESIVVPVTDPGQGLDPPGPSAFDPDDGNILEIMTWLNHYTHCANSNIDDPEIQAIPNQWTPLGRSLFYARLYFDNYVIPHDNPNVLPCRNNIVILVTDGGESCDSDLSNLDHEPTSVSDCSGGAQFNPIRQACLSFVPHSGHPYPVRTYVLTNTGLGGTGSNNDRIAVAGGTGHAWEADFTNQDEVKAALTQIIAEAVPEGETCNGIDDNCNGQTDEGVKNACSAFPQWCAEEQCNNIDDDCDGQTDEGLPLNACGGPCGAPVPEEICDGIDNDCDGLIDTNDPSYATGPDGSCPCTVEICDGIDNDCDGLIDTNDPDYQVPAGGCGGFPNVGQCQPGHWECGPNPDNGNRTEEYCTGGVGPEPETCNGLDDDCNGEIDDVVYDPSDCLVPDCQTGCCEGHWECVGGEDQCVPDQVGTPETCNGLDDDCDGRIDEGAQCPPGQTCFYGECADRIPPDGCPQGTYAVEGLCISDPCKASHCDSGLICDVSQGNESDGYCYDPCPNTNCDESQACDIVCDDQGCRAECQTPDCYLDPTLCGDGQICRDGQCVDDACFGSQALSCGDQACRDGQCVDSCQDVQCNEGFECLDGQCVEMTCDSSKCPPGRVCVDGQCAQDPCGGVSCGLGRVCRDGRCVDDPCRLIVCPSGAVCDARGQCVNETEVQPDAGQGTDAARDAAIVPTDAGPLSDAAEADAARPQDYKVSAAGGGGCACRNDASNPATSSWILLLSTILALVWRRRRR